MNKSTITKEEQQRIAAKVNSMTLPRGLGNRHSACSIAAINLALYGRLTDKIPDCMSPVIGEWIIRVQDSMPDSMRNSVEWKSLLPLAAGTGREKEKERLALIMEWMWESLALVQPVADAKGFGPQWAKMLTEKTPVAASIAAVTDDVQAAYAADNANIAIDAATCTAVHAATRAAVHAATRAVTRAAAWQKLNPCGLLQKLIEV